MKFKKTIAGITAFAIAAALLPLVKSTEFLSAETEISKSTGEFGDVNTELTNIVGSDTVYVNEADSDDGFTKGTEPDTDYYWKISESGILTIKGTKMAEYSIYYQSPFYTEHHGGKTIKKVVIEDGMENIGSYAFYECFEITSVTIPKSVASIGKESFCSCSSLLSVTIPQNVSIIDTSVFYDCNKLVRVNIEGNIEKVGDFAFYNCENLSQIVLPDGIESIGDNAFYNCSALTKINLPDSITIIGNYAFHGCSSLNDVVLPNEVSSIGSYAFYNCHSLTSIVIPETIESIDVGTFSYCYHLADVKLPNSLISINDNAFYYCTDMTSIEIPESALRIGSGAFMAAHTGSGLKAVVFKGNAPQIESNAFGNVIADIYYPTNDLTYTSTVKQDYNGTLTWKNESAPKFEPLSWEVDDDGTLRITGSFIPDYYEDNDFTSGWDGGHSIETVPHGTAAITG